MRLLQINDGGSFSLVEFTGQDIPRYAILSHTWGADDQEVTFKDMVSGTGHEKAGYDKIRFCARQAAADRLRYFWVDTCCIDKSSSAELTESINSMFTWYKEAARCYVFLVDLPPGTALSEGLRRCRWFTRGWTLQELLAPKAIMFYDQAWNLIGDRPGLAYLLSHITGITNDCLLGFQVLSTTSIATRMSWASRRQTKRIEDMAYCLLGIFDVNMPLIYGEGTKAFRRLQEEIIKRSNDLTVFAWDIATDSGANDRSRFISPLATSPSAFDHSHNIDAFANYFAEFSITNQGLLISGDTPLRSVQVSLSGGQSIRLYSIFLGLSQNQDGGIFLRKIGPNLFCREGTLPLAGFRKEVTVVRKYYVSETYILLDPFPATQAAYSYRDEGIHVPLDTFFDLRHSYPLSLWDETDRMFLRPKRCFRVSSPIVLIMKFDVKLQNSQVPLAVLCHNHRRGPVLKIFTQEQYPQEYEMISQAKYKQEGIHVQELNYLAPSIRAMGPSISVKDGNEYRQLTISLVEDTVPTGAGTVRISTLCFRIDEVISSGPSSSRSSQHTSTGFSRNVSTRTSVLQPGSEERS